ncbi:hypothetical protein AB1Y20_011509 [Prymnesium parvum]|uniref:DUF3419 family protein n=1 Tax=Prymnesium parvum TaxID=97485 RepID=A0AB34IK01_PRYPA
MERVIAVAVPLALVGLTVLWLTRRGSKGRPRAGSGALTLLKNEVLRYSQVWEDDALLLAALDVKKGDSLLAIASAGDNVLNLLLAEPKSILAVDVNPAQVALVQLKLAAIRQLPHADFLLLLGYASCEDAAARRCELRDKLDLPRETRAYWEAHEETLKKGIAGSGRLETYFRAFSEQLPSLGWPSDAIPRLFAAKSIDAQLKLWQTLCTPRFEAAFRKHFARETQAEHGRSEQQLHHVDKAEDISATLLERLKRMLQQSLCAHNFYFRRFIDAAAAEPAAGAPYLLEENYARLRQLLPRVTVRTQTLQEAVAEVGAGRFDKVYISDIFEYMELSDAHALAETFASVMPSGGRLAYWELYLARPPSPHGSFVLDTTSKASRMTDRNFFYRGFHVLQKK